MAQFKRSQIQQLAGMLQMEEEEEVLMLIIQQLESLIIQQLAGILQELFMELVFIVIEVKSILKTQ